METWDLTYLRHVLSVRGWTGSELAAKSGVSASTINRPLNAPDYDYRLSRRTLEKIADASGIDYRPFAEADALQPVITPPRQVAPLIGRHGIRLSFDGKTAHIEADVTLDDIPELRRKIDLMEAFLKS